MELEEQNIILNNTKKNMLVSASAGSGKTYIMIKYICSLICDKKIPLEKLLVLTFTKAAASQMKERLLTRLKEKGEDEYVISQIDALSTANISTIHSFCEKYLKKYANLLNLNANFSIIDENLLNKVKEDAFEKAFKTLKQNEEEKYLYLQASFKNNNKIIKEIVFKIEDLADSVADKEEFIKNNFKKAEEFFDNSCVFLFEYVKKEIENSLYQVERLHVNDFYDKLVLSLKDVLKSENINSLSEAAEDFSFPKLPLKKVVGEEAVDSLNEIKNKINKSLDEVKNLSLQSAEQREGKLEKTLLEFFEIYENEKENIKKSHNFLDFSDLEKYMIILSKKENLFSGIEYVFVDEYQDTNKIQEKIVKNIAKNCNFVAVGDVKQGIYGFRLASSEIFLKDLKYFETNQNSTVNYLQSNFRSSQKVLDFVNDVFKVCMRKEETNIDYEKTSMLKGLSEFADEDAKAVNIDLVDKIADEEEENDEVYSVKNATLFEKNQKNMFLDIKRRILEVLDTQISCDGKLRKARFADIAILSRKRDDFFNNLQEYLHESGIPVISNSRTILLEQPEIIMLLNFLKIVLCDDDDVALLSVLTGGLFRYDLQEIAERLKTEKLSEIVKKDAFFTVFEEKIAEFKLIYQVEGLKKAFESLILSSQYRAYLNEFNPKVIPFLDKFLDELQSFDFDLPGAINYFENVEISVTPEITVAEDSVLLTTIHNSKGLEYPIVFLIGCSQSLSKTRPNSEVKIDEKFGLAVKFKSLDDNEEITTARMRAISINQKKKEFAEEMMIFYVALTRAKNRLYLFGDYKNSIFNKQSIPSCDCYFDFIFFALKDIKNKFLNDNKYVDDKLEILHISNLEEEKLKLENTMQSSEFSQEKLKKLENYLDFSYVYDDNLNYRLKESVTALTKKQHEDVFSKFNNDNFNFTTNNIEIGNAYHAALKTIDFEKVEDLNSLRAEIEKNQNLFEKSLIDENCLLYNILLLKKFTTGGKVFKEKEFLIKESLCNLVDSSSNDKILVQGIIDLFIIKEDKIILIDYKYTNNDANLVQKYKEQLKLYKIALTEAFRLPIEQVYLLSLKTNKLFKIDF